MTINPVSRYSVGNLYAQGPWIEMPSITALKIRDLIKQAFNSEETKNVERAYVDKLKEFWPRSTISNKLATVLNLSSEDGLKKLNKKKIVFDYSLWKVNKNEETFYKDNKIEDARYLFLMAEVSVDDWAKDYFFLRVLLDEKGNFKTVERISEGIMGAPLKQYIMPGDLRDKIIATYRPDKNGDYVRDGLKIK